MEIPPLNPGKNYVIYFRGCFCPPHRGHFETIEHFLQMGPNFKVIIDQIGSEKRHGVPYSVNRKIWQTYIKELLPSNRVSLNSFDRFEDILEHKFITDPQTDVLLYLRGNEGQNVSQAIASLKDRFQDIIRELAYLRVELDFLYVKRHRKDTLSASKFVKTLANYNKHGCLCQKCRRKRNLIAKIEYFLPVNLSDRNKNRIINTLTKFRLH